MFQSVSEFPDSPAFMSWTEPPKLQVRGLNVTFLFEVEGTKILGANLSLNSGNVIHGGPCFPMLNCPINLFKWLHFLQTEIANKTILLQKIMNSHLLWFYIPCPFFHQWKLSSCASFFGTLLIKNLHSMWKGKLQHFHPAHCSS